MQNLISNKRFNGLGIIFLGKKQLPDDLDIHVTMSTRASLANWHSVKGDVNYLSTTCDIISFKCCYCCHPVGLNATAPPPMQF